MRCALLFAGTVLSITLAPSALADDVDEWYRLSNSVVDFGQETTQSWYDDARHPGRTVQLFLDAAYDAASDVVTRLP